MCHHLLQEEPPTIVFGDRVIQGPEAQLLDEADWPVSHKIWSVCASPELRLQVSTTAIYKIFLKNILWQFHLCIQCTSITSLPNYSHQFSPNLPTHAPISPPHLLTSSSLFWYFTKPDYCYLHEQGQPASSYTPEEKWSPASLRSCRLWIVPQLDAEPHETC